MDTKNSLSSSGLWELWETWRVFQVAAGNAERFPQARQVPQVLAGLGVRREVLGVIALGCKKGGQAGEMSLGEGPFRVVDEAV